MTRAAERPTAVEPEDDMTEMDQDELWQHGVEGEAPDNATTQALNLAHRATEKFPELANRYPRCSTDRDAAEEHNLEWVTPGHPLFEAIRRHTREKALEPFGRGACFYSLQHDEPARLDFYRARVVDGLGQVVHERLFAVELTEGSEPQLREPTLLGDFTPAARARFITFWDKARSSDFS